jgi:hypothetical protein
VTGPDERRRPTKMKVFPVIVLALLAAAGGPATAAEDRT